MKNKRLYLYAMPFLLAAGLAHAVPTYVVSGGELTKILDLGVGSMLYDVEFKEGTMAGVFGGASGFDFSTQADAIAAATALDAALVDGAAGNFDSLPADTFGCETASTCAMLIPYDIDGARTVSVRLVNTNLTDSIVAADDRIPSFDSSSARNLVWADWTALETASVPEPATTTLLLAGGLAALWRRPRKP